LDRVNNAISFRVPHVVKGAKSKRAKNVVEKQSRKKGSQEKGTYDIHYSMFGHLLLASYFFIICNVLGEEMRNTKDNYGANLVEPSISIDVLISFRGIYKSIAWS
jgi:hypothetical protein